MGDNCPGSSCPRGQEPERQLSWGNFMEGDCPVVVIQREISRGQLSWGDLMWELYKASHPGGYCHWTQCFRSAKKTLVKVFSCEYYEMFKNSFFIENFCWLLLSLSLLKWHQVFSSTHQINIQWFDGTWCHLSKDKDRSSQQRCSIKKDVLKNFAKFTGKYLYQSLF